MLVRLFSVLLLSILLVAGCARTGEQQGEVSGKVTYNGKPLPGGRITFFGAKGFTGHGIISPQGEYSLKSPLGNVKICMDNSMLKRDPEWEKHKGKAKSLKKPQDMKGGSELPQVEPAGDPRAKGGVTGTYVKIPARYTDPDASGLTYTVTEGSQTHNIELSDNPGSTPGS